MKRMLSLGLCFAAVADQNASLSIVDPDYYLVESKTCEHVPGCSSASSASECMEWISTFEQPQSRNVSLSINTAPRCYVFGKNESAWFNSGSEMLGPCSAERKCVCQCKQTPGTINVALYHDLGASIRGKENIYEVLTYQNSGISVFNFTSADVALHLNSLNAIDVILFPGGGARNMASTLGSAGREAVLKFVGDGGGYVGICAGAYLARTLNITAFKDMPRPEGVKSGRGDGNTTLSLTSTGTSALARFGVTPAALDNQLIFYANGPVMIPAGNSTAGGAGVITEPVEVLLRFNSSSVPIEKHYSGVNAGLGEAAVVVNGYNGRGAVLISGPHPETNVLDFPELDGPPSVPSSVEARLLQSYVKYACALSAKCKSKARL